MPWARIGLEASSLSSTCQQQVVVFEASTFQRNFGVRPTQPALSGTLLTCAAQAQLEHSWSTPGTPLEHPWDTFVLWLQSCSFRRGPNLLLLLGGGLWVICSKFRGALFCSGLMVFLMILSLRELQWEVIFVHFVMFYCCFLIF